MLFNLPQKGFNKEKTFTTRWGKNIKDNGGFFHKISDMDMGTKPFDAICGWEGKIYGVEIKMIPGMTCSPYSLLRGSSIKNMGGQVAGLERFSNHGESLVIVYSRKANKYKILDFKTLSLDYKISFNV